MASIPTITSPRFTPPPEMNPNAAGIPGRVVSDAGDMTTQIGEYGLQVANLVRKAQDEGIALDAENKINSDMENADTQLSAWTDYTQADQIKQTTADNLKQKYAAAYQDKPKLWRHIEHYLDKQLLHYNSAVDHRSVQLTTDFNKAALIHSQVTAENDAANELTIDGKERVWAEQDAKTDIMVDNGSISHQEAEVSKRLLRTRTITAEVDRAANPTNSPQVMRDELDRLKTYAGRGYVDSEKLEQLQDHLGRSLEAAETRADRVDVSKEGDATIAAYREDPTLKDPETGKFDPGRAAAKVSDDSSLSTKAKKYVREEFEQEDGARKKADNDRDQALLDHLDPHVETGKLTFSQLAQMENLPPGDPNYLPRRVADHLMTKAAQIQRENRVENMQARSEMRAERMDKSAELRDELLAQPGYIAEQSELTQFRLKGLSAGDANIVWKARAINSDPAYGLALKMFQSSSKYDLNTENGKAQLSKDIVGFAKTVEDKKLSGQQIIQEAQGELKPAEEAKTKSAIGTMLDNIWSGAKGFLGNEEANPAPPNAPASRSAYFDAMKKANPGASDQEINQYLDNKGVK